MYLGDKMDQETLRDIHARLGRIEGKVDTIIAMKESLKWAKRHIWALWAGVLGLLGLKLGG